METSYVVLISWMMLQVSIATPTITVNTLSTSQANVVEMPENSQTGTFLAHVVVTGEETSCFLESEVAAMEQLYSIEYKIVLTAPLDYEEQSSYQLKITCMGADASVAVKTLTLNVLDVSDTPPEIILSSALESGITISENSPPGTEIASFSTKNADFCTIEPSLHAVSLSERGDKYFIVSNMRFDRELTPAIEVRIVCATDSNPPMRTAEDIAITVTDINDNPPQFSHQTFAFSVERSSPVGSLVGFLFATDADEGDNGRVSIALESTVQCGGAFDVRENGELEVKKPLTEVGMEECMLSITATDHGTPKLSTPTTARITILERIHNKKDVYSMEMNHAFTGSTVSPFLLFTTVVICLCKFML